MDDGTAKSGCELQRKLLSDYYWKLKSEANEKCSEISSGVGFDILDRSSPDVELYWHWETLSRKYLHKIGQLDSMSCGEIDNELGSLEGKVNDIDGNSDWLDDFNDFIKNPAEFMNQMNQRAGNYVAQMFNAFQSSENKRHDYPLVNSEGKQFVPWTYDQHKFDLFVEGKSENVDFRHDFLIEYEDDVVEYYEELYDQVGPEIFCKMMLTIGNEHVRSVQNPVDINSPEWAVNAYRAQVHAVAFTKMKNVNEVSQECGKINTKAIMQETQSQYSQQPISPSQQNPILQDFQNKLQNNEYELPNPDDVDKWLNDKMGQ